MPRIQKYFITRNSSKLDQGDCSRSELVVNAAARKEKPTTPVSDREDDSDDDVVIIEELSFIKRPRLEGCVPKVPEPSNELKSKKIQAMQSETREASPKTPNHTDQPKTPNLQKNRVSFLNRRNRDSPHFPLTPTTPKLDKSMVTPMKIRSGGRNPLNSRGSSSSRRTSREGLLNKSIGEELISSTYSTPKTTRGLMTPNLSGSNKLKRRVTHLIYRPLELDNESSSESTESLARRRESLRKKSQDTDTKPLAIENATSQINVTQKTAIENCI